jgi:hypothetical protein
MEHAGLAAIPALTTSVGGVMGGPLGAAGGAAVGYLADKGLQNAIHGSGFYHKKHAKYQDAAYKKKVHDTMAALRSKRKTQFAKGSDEAKAHMAKLRAMRKTNKTPESKGDKKARSKAALSALMAQPADSSKVTKRKKSNSDFGVGPEDAIDFGGAGVKGSRSKTRPGRLDYETHKGDKYYHQAGHLVAGNPYSN